MPGPTELIIVLLVILLLFGGAKLPKLARSLGQAKNEFESGAREPAPELTREPTIERDVVERDVVERDVVTRRNEP